MINTYMPGMLPGVISMNYAAVEDILTRIDILVKKLYDMNDSIRERINRLEHCTGTRENPHNHNVEIAAYMRVFRKNEKDIKNLTTIYGQISNFKTCTQQTDQRLTKLIHDIFPEYFTPKAGGVSKSVPFLPAFGPLSWPIINGAVTGAGVSALQQLPDTSGNYGVNAAGINVVQTETNSSEWYYDITLALTMQVTQTNIENLGSYAMKYEEIKTVSYPCNIDYSFSYEVQEYMQSACDTVIQAAVNNNVSVDRIELMEKYLTPELIMAVGTTESGWVKEIGEKSTYTGIIDAGAPCIETSIGGEGASDKSADYCSVKESISGTAAMLAQAFSYIGTGSCGYNKKTYASDGQLIYDVLYTYAAGCATDYYISESRISTAYKLYAVQEFTKQRSGEEYLKDWDISEMNSYTDGITNFEWESNDSISSHSVVEMGD
jgi:hypothetical protein